MYPPLDAFGKAYQDELMQLKQRLDEKDYTNSLELIPAWDRMMLEFGERLISLGERVKGERACPEYSQGQA